MCERPSTGNYHRGTLKKRLCRLIALGKRNVLSQKDKRMSLPVLLLLSFLTVRCDGCDFGWVVVNNIQTAIESNQTEFRKAFPKDYIVEHHYKSSMLCDSDPCCVFSAAIVLVDSWTLLLANLWDEHLNYGLIFDLKRALDTILKKNKHTARLQEETDLSTFPYVQSSPEELLNLTSGLFSRWIKVGCFDSIKMCLPPTLAPAVAEWVEQPLLRARLLTTRDVKSLEEVVPWEKLNVNYQPENSSPLLSQTLSLVCSPLFFGLYWGLLP